MISQGGAECLRIGIAFYGVRSALGFIGSRWCRNTQNHRNLLILNQQPPANPPGNACSGAFPLRHSSSRRHYYRVEVVPPEITAAAKDRDYALKARERHSRLIWLVLAVLWIATLMWLGFWVAKFCGSVGNAIGTALR